MTTFKTPQGTEIPLLNLKGKQYLQVQHRVQWFREDHPTGIIKTSFEKLDDNQTVARAEIYVINATSGQANLVATATKRETKADFNDHTEKAESGAVGRALALFGYGTQFALDLTEGERIVDAPLNAVATATQATVDVLGAKPANNVVQGRGFKKVATDGDLKLT